MKKFSKSLLGYASITALTLVLSAQQYTAPVEYSQFDSNIGVQQVADVVHRWVGPTPQELAPRVIPLGSLKGRKYVLKSGERFVLPSTSIPVIQKDVSSLSGAGQTPDEMTSNVITLGSLANTRQVSPASGEQQKVEGPLFNAALFASLRPYYSHNVLRTDGGGDGSFVTEALLGASLSTRGIPLGGYVTMIPSIDLITQFAFYQDKEISGLNIRDLLGYHFSLVKTGLKFQFPHMIDLSLGYEYNLVRSLDTGDRISDALAPSLRLSKSFLFGERTMLMADASLRYSFTDRVLPYAIPGQFADDADNLQTGLSLSLVQLLGSRNQFMIMPSLSFYRSAYVNNENNGRVDWLTSIGLSGNWQLLDWLSLDLGLSYTLSRMNEQGRLLQGEFASYEALDIGITLLAAHQF